jgi:glycosyltransferase involved in cell wall biosynthesis
MPAMTPRPKVLVVSPLYHTDRGGLGRQSVLLTEFLVRQGVQALVATRYMTGLPERDFDPRVEIARIPAGRPDVHNYERPDVTNLLTSLRFSLGVARLMNRRRRDWDLVHFHGASLPLLATLPVAALRGKRIVAKVAALHQGVEAGDLSGHWGPLGPLMARSLRRVDAFVATTAEIGDALVGEGYAPERIARIPNFVEVSRFRVPAPDEREELRRALGLTGRRVILHSGRLAERKACDLLLDAYAKVLAADHAEPRPLLLFLGDGPKRAALEAQASRLGLADAVRFEGFHVDVWRYLAAADLFVLSSRVEGLPNALLEAMAVGLPVLATRLGGSLEAVEPGTSGVLIPVDDRAALAEGLARLLGDPTLRAELGRGAAARIQAKFTLESVAPRYLDLYARLLHTA